VWHDKVRIFPSQPELPSQVVNAAVTDHQGDIWLGFQDGSVSCYQEGKFQMYSLSQGVLALHCDTSGQIWAAGLGGLSRFTGDHFETLETTGHLPTTGLSGLIEDDQGFFWIASRVGLLRVARAEIEKAFANSEYRINYDAYGASDGLRGFPRQSRPFPIATKTRDGRIWFATTAGLAMIDPTRLKKNTNTPPVYIVQTSAGGHKLDPTPNMELPAGTKDIKIDYTALSFFDPERIEFKCKLEGYDAQWREAGSTRQMSYSGLSPRHYVFRVMACNYDGVWGDVGAEWTFSVRPAFYQTNWFLIASLLIGGLMIWGFYRWNLIRATLRTEARMNARLEVQMDERKRIAQELHDTILQGFTGIRLKLWAVSQQLGGSPSTVGDQLKQVIHQADKCLSEARRSVWALRLPRLDETDLTTALKTVVKDLVSDTPLQWDFKTSGKAERLSDIVEFNLLRICEEAVTNVIRHAEAKTAVVELYFEKRKVTLKISDDGRGFDPNRVAAIAEGHFGLAGMKERAKIIGGNLLVHSQPGGPTVLTVTVG
jgi:signal transduction histidine kinase